MGPPFSSSGSAYWRVSAWLPLFIFPGFDSKSQHLSDSVSSLGPSSKPLECLRYTLSIGMKPCVPSELLHGQNICILSTCLVPSWSCWHDHWSLSGLQRPLCLLYENWVPPGNRDHGSRSHKKGSAPLLAFHPATYPEVIYSPHSGLLLTWLATAQNLFGGGSG